MLRQMLPGALIAGAAAGIVAALLHIVFVTPSLMEAELFETGARVHFADGTIGSPAGSPALGPDWGRHLGTLGFDIITFAGFGLMLTALYALAEMRGARISGRTGLIWGLAGFVALHLAPAFGLPPEPPGIEAADLAARQLWWTGTVAASAVGLGLIAFGPAPWAPVAGIALLAAPHLVGAPHLPDYSGVVPPELAARFATLSLGAAAASWAVLGWLAALVYTRKEA
ncbi:MAG: CbtA family protein [Maritimibacter sp.]|nr:CbtA family protein [Maritimibacter sp.]